MSRRQSSRLLQSTNGDQDFVVDNDDAPSLNGETIEPDDSWFTVWDKLRSAGWKWKGGSKSHDYLYLKPNISNIKDKRQGIDYFIEEDHVKKYASIKYGWSNSLDHNSDDDSTNDSVSSSLTDNDDTNNNLAIKSPKKEPTTTNRTPNKHNIIRDVNISSDDSTKCVEMCHVKKKNIGKSKPIIC